MFSKLRPDICYKNLSPEIAKHDQDIDADEWDYNGRIVYRGLRDPLYDKEGLSVYWLYDSDVKRVGLSEHEKNDEEKFEALWFQSNEFSTLLQEDWTSLDKTLWSLLSPEAYQDCLEDDFKNVIDRTLSSNVRIVTPEFIQFIPDIYECQTCKTRSISEMKKCSTVKKTYLTSSIFFVDSNFVLFVPPKDSCVWSKLKLQPPSYDVIQASPQPEPQPEPLQQPVQTLQPEEHHQAVPSPEHQESHP